MFARILWILLYCVSAQAATPILLQIDATEAPRRIFHAHLQIPVSAGPLTLYYPKWIPGDHSPDGPIASLTGLRFEAKDRPVRWKRDAVDMFTFHLDVPEGVNKVDASFDLVVPSDSQDWTFATDQRLALGFWTLLLYPPGRSDDLVFQASITLPAGWKYATALQAQKESPGTILFAPASLTTLIDSPLIAGKYFRRIPLAPDHEIDLVSESSSALELKDDLIEKYKRLIPEANTLFGAHHYSTYRFLVTLSDVGVLNGQEHHESSDDRIEERAFQDEELRQRWAYLLPHEYVHSWNGKYRRPAGLATPDYQQPMKGELLWVYEGLTQYLGFVLTARSGLWTAEEFRENLARVTDSLDHTAGRTWRPLQDTADAAQVLYSAPGEWESWRRSVDFYNESVLIWLEADTIIRQGTDGKFSLDDFCKRFHGGRSGPPEVKPYTLDDVTSALNEIYPHDWKRFFEERVNSTDPHAPRGGLQQSGWRLVYTNVPNGATRARNAEQHLIRFDAEPSIGMTVKEDGTIQDVVPGMAAAKAGIPPGSKLVAVNGRRWTEDRLQQAIASSKGIAEPIVLLVLNGDTYRDFSLDYHEGEKYPHLERDPSRPDLLEQIIHP